ncbi:MAG: winged helix-turn-helix domain-containing tetratricopeptide repeat protein [Blastocatellales bacterium]
MNERFPKVYYSFGSFRVDPHRRTLWRDGKVVALAPKAFDMLLMMLENEGQVLEKQQLMDHLWPGSIVEEANLSQTVYLLRRALAEGSDERQYIETIPKRGYRFAAEIVESRDEKIEETASEPTLMGQDGILPHNQTPQSAQVGQDAILSHDRTQRRPVWIASGVALLAVAVTAASYLWSSRQTVKIETGGHVRSLAVLPFKPLNASGDDKYLGLAMADVLITRLSSINEVIVQPTSSVRKYDNQDAHPLAAGRELKVDAVLEGTLVKTADRLRVTLRMYDVRDGQTLWSGKFDEKFTDIFNVQDSISDQVAAALALNLTREKRELMVRRYTGNAEAYELYLKGRYWWNRRSGNGLKKAAGYFEQAIATSPTYALAYAGLADCYNLLSIIEVMPPREAFPRARTAAIKALELDDTLAEAHTSLGWIKWVYDWDWAGAEQEFNRAIELSPNYVTGHDWYGVCLAQRGRFDEALSQLEQARRLDPLSLVIPVHIGWVYFYAGQYDRAIEQYQKALEMDPNYAWARAHLSQAYEQKEMYVEAIAEMRKVMEFSTNNHRHQARLGHIYAGSGDRDEAGKLLAVLLEREKKQYVSPYSIAVIYAGLDDKERSLAWLRKAAEHRVGRLVRLPFDPRFKNLRSDPRFAEILRRIDPASPTDVLPALAKGQR